MNKSEIQFIVDKCVEDETFRRELVKTSLFWFMYIYFPDYLTFPLAEFHKEMIKLVEGNSPTNVIAAFRGSGKSTIISLAYVIWSMIGIKNKRFILLTSNTARQAELLMFNIKNVLESHSLLKTDLGPFQETSEEWNIGSLVFKDYDAKIMAISVNESVRGIKYKSKRPDLIICDDIETLESTGSSDNREKLLTWFDRDIVPIGDEHTTLVMVGTIMTDGSLMQTLKSRIDIGQLNGVFKKYPVIDEEENILWKDRWVSKEALDAYRKDKGILQRTWETEFLLNSWVEEDQIIKPEHINYYDDIPFGLYPSYTCFMAVDLAISKEDTADKTAILQGYMFNVNGQKILYILPDYANKRLNFHETIQEIEKRADQMKDGKGTYIIVENVGYQSAVIETLKLEGYHNTRPFDVHSQDKPARLETTLHNLSLGKVLFPKKGCEVLIDQLYRFGRERYDDLADAFSMLVIKSHEISQTFNSVIMVDAINCKNGVSYSHGEDWADREDRNMLGRLGKNWTRICG